MVSDIDGNIWHDVVGSEWTDVSNDTIKGKIMDTARTSFTETRYNPSEWVVIAGSIRI
jgi:hypothetical protein